MQVIAPGKSSRTDGKLQRAQFTAKERADLGSRLGDLNVIKAFRLKDKALVAALAIFCRGFYLGSIGCG